MLRGRLLVAGHRADQGRGRRSAENLFGCFLYGSAGSCHSVKDSDILHENWTLIRAVKSEQACCFDALATAICLFCHCPRRRVVAKDVLLLCNVLQRSANALQVRRFLSVLACTLVRTPPDIFGICIISTQRSCWDRTRSIVFPPRSTSGRQCEPSARSSAIELTGSPSPAVQDRLDAAQGTDQCGVFGGGSLRPIKIPASCKAKSVPVDL
jgi:hypothetical protein